jgi:asparagine synthase (glutamine-hydrolysing)
MVATIPADIKFKDGTMKRVLKDAMRHVLPDVIVNRKDKMGFPTPLNEWLRGEAHEFVRDILTTQKALNRDVIDNRKVVEGLDTEPRFGRKIWGLLSLELWQQEFHDKAHYFRELAAGS